VDAVRHRLSCRPVGGLVTGLFLTGCVGSASAGGGSAADSFLSGKDTGWYDGIRFLTYTESNNHLTGTLSAVSPEANGARRGAGPLHPRRLHRW
jgi:hypothetical protein